jgi:hypothetical protein
MALNNLAVMLSEMGRQQEALAPAEEAATTYRTLAQTNPDAHLPNLASALNNLANHLSGVGRQQEALPPAEEAATTYRTLAQTNPDAHLPNLASALNNLANTLSGVGRQQEALPPAEEAVQLRRTLAQTNPDAHLPNLASALNNLANHLSGVGRRQEALQYYETVIAEWSGPPQAAAELALHQAVFLFHHAETTRGIQLLCGLLTSPAPITGETVLHIHRQLRAAVATNPELREPVTRLCAEHGTDPEPPSWLDVTDEALQLTAGWVSTRTWTESRDFLTSHPALLAPASRAALQEWALLEESAVLHIELLDHLSSGTPADAIYRPLILPETLTEWIRTGTGEGGWAASAAFLSEHADDLLAPGADATLAALDRSPGGGSTVIAVHRAILALAGSDGVTATYALLEDRRALHARTQTALTAADALALSQLALIEGGVYGEAWSSTVHLLAARALDDPAGTREPLDGADSGPGAAGQAAESIAQPSAADVLAAAARARRPDADERNRAVAEIAALMAVRPARAEALGELLGAVLATEVQAAGE